MRRQALVLVQALDAVEAAVVAGERSAAVLLELVGKQIARAPSAELDYAELRDPETLDVALQVTGPTLLALAATFPAAQAASARVRLIDNRVLRPQVASVAPGHDSQQRGTPR
jgi:pantoate--beta-alanine ligase